MSAEIRNLLYRRPELYEAVYPEPNDETPAMCRRMFARYLAKAPRAILDVGCGTARDLESLAKDGADCQGVDFLPEVIACAQKKRPHLRLEAGDMRNFRLNRSFEAILCLGSALMYALTNTEVDQTLETLAAHAHPGTLLILDLNNAASLLAGGHFKPVVEMQIDQPGFKATARATHRFDRRQQRLIRERTWEIEGEGEVKDYCEYRLFFPAELDHLLKERGFEVKGMFDNIELKETDLSGRRLYVAAIFGNKQDAGRRG